MHPRRHTPLRRLPWLLLALAAPLQATPSPPPNPVSDGRVADSKATRLFKKLRPAIFVLRTVPSGGKEASVSGTAFFVDAKGHAVTNYHVIAGFARKPQHQRIEAVMANDEVLPARVVQIDVVNDLALLQIDIGSRAVHTVSLPARDDDRYVGMPIHALGDGVGLGVALMSGHFSGMLQMAGVDRLHFSGAVNHGMSGGPAVNDAGVLVGVVVGKHRDAEQVGLLVPVAAVRKLVANGPAASALDVAQLNREIRRQLVDFQSRRLQLAMSVPWTTAPYGSYKAPDFLKSQLPCQPEAVPDDDGDADNTTTTFRTVHFCGTRTNIDIDDSIDTGYMAYSHTHLRSSSLNRFRFHRLVERVALSQVRRFDNDSMARQHCVDQLTHLGARALPVRMLWCAQAYRDFDDLYAIKLVISTHDRPDEALVTRLSLEGVTWEIGRQFSRRLMESIE